MPKREVFERAEEEIDSINFRNEDLSRCGTGENVTFARCDFSKVNFVAADLSGVTFKDCKFLQTDFENASLLGTTFGPGCDLTTSNLRNADCRGAVFAGSILNQVDATAATFEGSRFFEC
jgi:uncharacterized protein YjbI with pentapeptide repeats